MNSTTIRTNIEKLMAENGIQQKQLAHDLNISPSSISRFISKEKRTKPLIESFSRYFNVSEDVINDAYPIKTCSDFMSWLDTYTALFEWKCVSTAVKKAVYEKIGTLFCDGKNIQDIEMLQREYLCDNYGMSIEEIGYETILVMFTDHAVKIVTFEYDHGKVDCIGKYTLEEYTKKSAKDYFFVADEYKEEYRDTFADCLFSKLEVLLERNLYMTDENFMNYIDDTYHIDELDYLLRKYIQKMSEKKTRQEGDNK